MRCFRAVLYPWGGESKNAEAGWKLRRRKICSRCLREDKLVRQMITFWHDQGGKCNANKTRMKQMNWRNLPSCVPFILLVCLSTTDHTTQETRPTAGSTCRRETHLMPSYPEPAPHSRGGPTPRSGGELFPQHVRGKRFTPWFSSRVCPTGRSGVQLQYQNFAQHLRR